MFYTLRTWNLRDNIVIERSVPEFGNPDVEEGMRKGPQTIEKAKQGAYVARSVSSLQKIRMRDGQIRGFLEARDGQIRSGLYRDVLREIIDGHSAGDVGGFILTVGIVSNHGNWFTSDNHNKELRVLAQSYDWLLFLTDAGLCQFVDATILNPRSELEPVRHAFLQSYSGASSGNRFTKVRIDAAADDSLRTYFRTNENAIGGLVQRHITRWRYRRRPASRPG